MTRDELVSAIAKKEGKKVQTPIGNIREIVSIIEDMQVTAIFKGETGPLEVLHNGINRKIAMRKKKKG